MDSTGRGRGDTTLSKGDVLGDNDIVEVRDHENTLLKGHSGGPEDSSRDPPASQSLSQVNDSDGRRRSLEKGEGIEDESQLNLEPLSGALM
jgi:hypothetical protein